MFLGSTAASETTAANIGATGVLRRDPMAMLPFCGYNMGDYFQHWINMGDKLGDKAPKVFYVNWFRKENGKFLWPGYGENSRVLKWMVDRLENKVKGVKSPIGIIPAAGELDLTGLQMPKEQMEQLMKVDVSEWKNEVKLVEEHFARFGKRLPARLQKQLDELRARLQ